jgi:DNA-directed RNA polymerases I and III subunit RPAC1
MQQQKERFADNEPRMVYDDIIVAKLRPGQVIKIEAHCVKGTGRDHAKWSPVCTASYRLLPRIELETNEIQDAYADELVAMCPTNVFDIEDLGNGMKHDQGCSTTMRTNSKSLSLCLCLCLCCNAGHRTATVARPRNCTMCRECIRHPGWSDRVKLKRVKNHFICMCARSPSLLMSISLWLVVCMRLMARCDVLVVSVESSGALTPDTLLKEALKILIDRCKRISEALAEASRTEEESI